MSQLKKGVLENENPLLNGKYNNQSKLAPATYDEDSDDDDSDDDDLDDDDLDDDDYEEEEELKGDFNAKEYVFNEPYHSLREESGRGHPVFNEAYKNRLREVHYNAIMSGQDILIDSDGKITLFGLKLVTRRFSWNPRTQSFEKMAAGPVRTKKGIKPMFVKEGIRASKVRKEELVD